ncbi:MAG: hypothetical protein AB1478_10955 [Nitrospirota bacterium]
MAKRFERLGFKIRATRGTYKFLTENGVQAEPIDKMHEGRPVRSNPAKLDTTHLTLATS